MGKGDKRTRKGKIFGSSYGKTRPANHAVVSVTEQEQLAQKKTA